MATTEAPATEDQKVQEFWLRVKRTLYQVGGAFVGVSGPLALAQLKTDDGITETELNYILISGGTAALALGITIVMNYFNPKQTNP